MHIVNIEPLLSEATVNSNEDHCDTESLDEMEDNLYLSENSSEPSTPVEKKGVLAHGLVSVSKCSPCLSNRSASHFHVNAVLVGGKLTVVVVTVVPTSITVRNVPMIPIKAPQG